MSEEFKLFVAAVAKADEKVGDISARYTPEASAHLGDIVDRVFKVEGDGLELAQVPATEQPESDGLLLLLYGFRKLLKLTGVTSSQLSKAAKDSGIEIGRVDQQIKPFLDVVMKMGKKSGTRYALKTAGVQKAEALLREVYG